MFRPELEKLIEDQSEVSISGRLMALRGKGKAVFANIQAQHQRLQIYIRKDEVGENSFEVFGMFDIGDNPVRCVLDGFKGRLEANLVNADVMNGRFDYQYFLTYLAITYRMTSFSK